METVQEQKLEDLGRLIAQRVRARRLAEGLTQAGLAQRAGITLIALKRFERSGRAPLASLLRIAEVLCATAEFFQLFPEGPPPRRKRRPRQRGRIN